MVEYKYIPFGLKLISIWYYISAIMSVFFGLLIIIGETNLIGFNIIGEEAIQTILSYINSSTFFEISLVAVVYFVLGAFYLFIGRGLWRGSYFARTLAITISIIGVSVVLINIMNGLSLADLIYLVVNILVALYLMFSKNIRNMYNYSRR